MTEYKYIFNEIIDTGHAKICLANLRLTDATVGFLIKISVYDMI